jgi:uncharacterized protein (DUF1330 family)
VNSGGHDVARGSAVARFCLDFYTQLQEMGRRWEGSDNMAAYLIVEHNITDATKFEEYRVKVAPMIAKYGGRYLTKGGTHKFPEGGHWKPERVVIIEFPDMDALNAWYTAPEYQPLIKLRKESTSDLDMLMVLEGAT